MEMQRDLLESLIKSGIHWGHQRSRRNPKMDPYIWGHKSNIHLIDVSKTARGLEKAADFLKDKAENGGTILWVGTKKSAQKAIKAMAEKLKMPSVTHRWVGGTLSNFGQVKKSVTKLLHFEDVISKSEKFPHYTKKELNVIDKNIERLVKNVGGIRNLRWPVAAIVIIDIVKERSALKEAAQMGVPVVALVDTNADPTLVNYVIPGNDDAPKAIEFVVEFLGAAIEKGLKSAKVVKKDEVAHDDSVEAPSVDFVKLLQMDEEEGTAKKRGKVEAVDPESRGGAGKGKPVKPSRPRVAGPKKPMAKK